MRAIELTSYGPPDVLKVVDAPKPTPTDDEVLVRIRAASINALDWRLMLGKPYLARVFAGGLRRPRRTRPGVDFSGEVEAIGRNVTRFKPGDEVFGACRGSFAEHGCAVEGKLAMKPAGVSFEDAAALPVAGLTALQGLRDIGHIQEGQQVLVDGASGGVGTFAVQIAKAFGAVVTAVCSPRNVEMARSIGAEHVIDYTRDDFSQSGRRYDLIIGANAYHTIFDYRRALSERGIFVMAGGGGSQLLQGMVLGPLLSLVGSRKLRFVMAKLNRPDLDVLAELVGSGKIMPVIDRSYPLSDVADALRYVLDEHARGKVIITVATGSES